MKPAKPYQIAEYLDESGKSPFRDWLESIDVHSKARIQARIFRFETGNLGDYKVIGGGVYEARFDFGPGYRVYFGIDNTRLILLLFGGDKKSQGRDIQKARKCWLEHQKGRKNV